MGIFHKGKVTLKGERKKGKKKKKEKSENSSFQLLVLPFDTSCVFVSFYNHTVYL